MSCCKPSRPYLVDVFFLSFEWQDWSFPQKNKTWTFPSYSTCKAYKCPWSTQRTSFHGHFFKVPEGWVKKWRIHRAWNWFLTHAPCLNFWPMVMTVTWMWEPSVEMPPAACPKMLCVIFSGTTLARFQTGWCSRFPSFVAMAWTAFPTEMDHARDTSLEYAGDKKSDITSLIS